ncbi:MAG TPA: PEGA domain-containing protein [Thermoanaerobaculia bacterium]|nr:PEGA domain-containing protein [Thermoanaerobaculia bacterium]
MSKFIRIIALTAIVLTTVSAQPKDSETVDAARTSVVIDSRPEHAEIHVNGKFVGTTPLSYALTSGEHRIELKRLGYGGWERALTVSPKTPTRVVAILQPSERQTQCSE